MRVPAILLLSLFAGVGSIHADDKPLPLNCAIWSDPSFVASFNGSYRPEARIEPTLTSAERGVLVDVQKLMADGKRDDAAAKLSQALNESPTAALFFNLGNVCFELGKTEDAIDAFEKAIESFPSFRRAHRNLGIALIRAGRNDAALKPMVEAVRLGDMDGTTLGMLGYLRLNRGEYASALQAYRQAQLTQPEAVEWMAGIAQALAQLERSAEAVALLDEVIAARPAEPSYLLMQAQMMAAADRDDDAIVNVELARRLMRAASGDGAVDLAAEDLLFLASLYLRTDAGERARDVLLAAVMREPAAPLESVVRPLAHLVRGGQVELAEPVVEAVEKRYADAIEGSADFLRTRARIDLQREREDRAVAVLEQLIAKDPTDGESQLVLARELGDRDPERSALLFERAAMDESVAYEAWVGLAQLQAGRGYYQRAVEAAKKAQEVSQNAGLGEYIEALEKLAK
ncbi:tetratricopeptide repeat protein [Sulfuriroseicoccus oceanibius]|uniref:Tetratricopeptide repeat protein n=1 Tax=Sulfuriroseicoccus oceanibius TaxID=2707525 RepID=A0A6B3L8A9_9BACT|nr:tetratricopeptide repeat protein [Sulfuriroseicoccus oceanibius]QQL46326.1 tetratricopeptide repeat protein [Sulfuriroseicoccus oceanibius]